LGSRDVSSIWLGPSFSWVSINGAVNYRFARHSYSGTRTYHSELISVQYNTIGCGAYSRAASGSSLTMCGYTVPARLQMPSEDHQAYTIHIGCKSFAPCTDQRDVCEFSIDADTNTHKKGETKEDLKNIARIDSFNESCEETERNVLLISLYSIQFRNDIYQVFLILRVPRHNSRIYERIGIGTGKIYGGDGCENDILNIGNVPYPFQWLSNGSEKGAENVTKQEVCIQ
jgi:hypothetical protein